MLHLLAGLDWKLVATLAALLLVLQGVCFLLARGLGLWLRWQPAALGIALPLLLLAPWFSRSQLLAPCNILRELPDAVRNRTDLAALPKPDPYDGLNDVMYQLLPWELEVRHALAERRLPFWSDLVDGGSNLWANPQAGVLSPVEMLARAVPIQHHLLAALALKLLLCFEGTWLLCRRLGRSRAASGLAATAFALGGGVMGWAVFPISSTLAWVPWLTAGAIGLFRRPRPRAVATTAVLAAALLVSGHPETAAIGGLFAALCGLCLRRRRAGLRRSLLAASAAAILGFGLAAPHVLPFLAVVPASQRAQETLADSGELELSHFAEPSFWLRARVATFVVSPTNPHAYGRPYREPFRGPYTWPEAVGGYVGLLPFAGFLIALCAVRHRRAAPFLAFAVASLLVTARWLPFTELAEAVPWLRVLAISRCLPVGSLALAVGGACGIDAMLERSRRWPLWLCFGAAAAISLAVRRDGWVIVLWVLAAGVLVAGGWSRRGAVLLASLVLLLDLVPWSRGMIPSCVPDLFYPRTPFIERVAEETGGRLEGRAVGARQLLFPSLLPVYGVAEPRPHNPLAPMPYLDALDAAFAFRPTRQNYFPGFYRVDHPLLDFLNVRVVVGSIEVRPPRTLERLDGGRPALYHLYRNPDALPRWFLTDRVDVIERGEARDWIRRMSDPRRIALFRDELTPGWAPVVTGAVEARDGGPGHVVLALPAPGEKLLATSIPAAPGWRVAGTNGPLRLVTVNGAFLGVAVPAGAMRVALSFRPPGLLPGLVAGSLAALAVVALAVRGSRTARRRRGPGDE